MQGIWFVLSNPYLLGLFILLISPIIWAGWVIYNREKTAAEDAKKVWQYIQKHR